MKITYLGPTPSELLERNQSRGQFFDDHGEYFLATAEKWI